MITISSGTKKLLDPKKYKIENRGVVRVKVRITICDCFNKSILQYYENCQKIL